jgi:5S rRNA maturation endonuclease (ribonuclease M5)
MSGASGARPVALTVSDLRSVHGRALELPLGALTVLVGPNRAGASSVAHAFALAVDPTRPFEPEHDLPRGPDGRVLPDLAPAVALTFADGTRRRVRFDAVTGTRREDRAGGDRAHADSVAHAAATPPRGPGGRVLVSRVDDTPRDLVRDVAGEPELVVAFVAHLERSARAVLGEDVAVEVRADGRVEVRDGPGVEVPVAEVRALAAIALARVLAEHGRAPVGLVVEAPEAFLHPSAQVAVAAELLALALDTGVPVVVTSTSPFVLLRREEVRVVALARDAEGVTRLVASARGDEPQARTLGGLVGDEGLAAVLDRTGGLDPGLRGVLVVEGGTDVAYLRLAARLLDREQVLDGVRVHDAGGAMGAALAAIVLRAESDVPVVVLLDHDDQGRRARDTLVKRFGFDRQREVMTYADVFEGGPLGVEAETLFDLGFLERFVDQRGRSVVAAVRRIAGARVPDLTSSGKAAFVPWAEERATRVDVLRWRDLLDRLGERFGT